MFKTLKRTADHIRWVQEMLLHIIDGLRTRMLLHDQSKFNEDEFKGYMRFEEMPEGLKYGSEEYKQAMAKVMKDNDCFKLHSARNDHHPEFYTDVKEMPLLAVIEMVADWAGAKIAHRNKGDWMESVQHNLDRWEFSEGQRWVILQMAGMLEHTVGINSPVFDPDEMWVCVECGGEYHRHPYEEVPKDDRICAKCYHLQESDEKHVSEKKEHFAYIESKIKQALKENTGFHGELFIDLVAPRANPHPDDTTRLMWWRVMANHELIVEGNWEAWMFEAGQVLLADLEDKYLPGTKWEYSGIHQNDDLESNVFVGFKIGLMRTDA